MIASRRSASSVDVGQFLHQLRGQFRQVERLDLEHLEDARHLLRAEGHVGRVGAELRSQLAGLAAADAGHRPVETLDLAVAETEHRAEPNDLFRGAGEDLVAMLEGEVRGDVIARFRRGLDRHEAAAVGQDPLQGPVDVFLGELSHGLLDLQALPLRHVELRPDLQVELEGHGAFFREFDRLEIQVRLADGRELVFVVDLRQAVHQQRALDPAGHVLAETVLDQFPRGVPRTEAGHVGLGHQFAELLVQVTIDVLARHRHGDVPLAGAPLVDLDFELQRNLLFALAPFVLFVLVDDRLVGEDLSRLEGLRPCQGFVVVVFVFVCHDRLPLARNWTLIRNRACQGPLPGKFKGGDWSLVKKKERVMGFEPTTTTLATSCSTN